MTKVEIIEQLPHLTCKELAEVQAKIDELLGGIWIDNGELSNQEKRELDQQIVEDEKNPNQGVSWEEAKARIRSQLELQKTDRESDTNRESREYYQSGGDADEDAWGYPRESDK